MKTTISVGGRFHAFYMAQQFLKRGYLERLITSYPKFEVVKYGILKEKISSNITKEVIYRGWEKLPAFMRNAYNPQYFVHNAFDRWASRKVVPSDLFIGFSSFSLHTLRRAKALGAVGVIERGNAHITYQQKIVGEEHARFGAPFNITHPKIVEKELQEYKEADYIAIPSLYVKKSFLEMGVPEEKLVHVPYGVDLKAFRQIPKTDNVFRVIFAGGMTLRKGVHYLLEAFSELCLANAELVLIGSMNDEMKPFFEKYRGSFKWLGHIPQKELYKHYSQGSVFVLPSIDEGLAMVQPQAMACGLPLICSTNTGGEDIVRNGVDGFVIPVRSVEAIKEKILYLYNHPDICKKMGESARERVASGFTWDDYGRKLIAKYEHILAKRKKGV